MSVTLLETRNAVRARADMSGSAGPDQFVQDPELNGYINASLAEFNDIIISKNLRNYVTSSQFSLTPTSNSYPLSSSFYKLEGVDRLISGDPTSTTAQWYDVFAASFKERNAFNSPYAPLYYPPFVRYLLIGNTLTFVPAQSCQGTYQIWWYPKAPVLVNDSDTYDDTQYWWEYIVVDSAIKCLQKEESDVSVLLAQKEALKQRINQMAADRDYGQPQQVGNRAMRMGNGFGSPFGGGFRW